VPAGRRELPFHRLLDGLSGLGLLVVDGYADLDPAGRPGLGAHAHAEFGIAVIGVAKSRFRTATHAVPVLRGSSARPLFVTAAGMPAADAADLVRHMAGRYRLPDALRRADTLSRTGPPAARVCLHHRPA
jgi:deoxyribonuclease V